MEYTLLLGMGLNRGSHAPSNELTLAAYQRVWPPTEENVPPIYTPAPAGTIVSTMPFSAALKSVSRTPLSGYILARPLRDCPAITLNPPPAYSQPESNASAYTSPLAPGLKAMSSEPYTPAFARYCLAAPDTWVKEPPM